MSRPASSRLCPGRIVVAEEAIQKRVRELGEAIAGDYAGRRPVLVGVLQGAFLFMADLIRAISIDVATDFIGLASYGASTHSTGVVRLTSDLSIPIEGRDVLIVEDILETGTTLAYLKRMLEARRPQSVRICVLLDKPRGERAVTVDYVGFTIPNVFVVGYGLDYDGLYRNLPYVAALESADEAR